MESQPALSQEESIHSTLFFLTEQNTCRKEHPVLQYRKCNIITRSDQQCKPGVMNPVIRQITRNTAYTSHPHKHFRVHSPHDRKIRIPTNNTAAKDAKNSDHPGYFFRSSTSVINFQRNILPSTNATYAMPEM